MSFIENKSQQISLSDSMDNLTDREKGFLHRSWAKPFSENIFPNIDETRFSVLYSGNRASRPNTPVNIIVGALLLRELLVLTDDEVVEALMFDIRFQYALHTTSFDEQPLSDRTLSRFRARCHEHEAATGEDLIKDAVLELSGEMASIMKISPGMKRMDSLMVASNIKNLSRLELLYTCVSNLAKHLHGQGGMLPDGLESYCDPSDYNRVIYHSRSTDTDTRIEKVISDAKELLEACGPCHSESEECRLLQRAMGEQTITDDSGNTRLRTKEDGGMHSGMLQNPSDPDATYREKGGKHHKGYAANVVESVGENGSIVTHCDYDRNTHSDSQFLADALGSMGEQADEVTIVADGAYSGTANMELAEENNVRVVVTELAGRETKDIYADFKFSEDGRQVLECPVGGAPKSCSHSEKTGQCRVSFHRSQCEGCPNQEQCNPTIYKHTAAITISRKSSGRAEAQRRMNTEEYRELRKFRNGVESVPSVLRRKYNVDTMPVRGKIRTKLFFGFMIAALNFKKLVKYLAGGAESAQIPETA